MADMGATGAMRQRAWHVLVVDDEENLNWGVVASLRRDQYVADGALTGEEAIRRLTEATYDCVISDVKMPGMDGFDLLLWLREHHPQTRVIMMTAFGSPTIRQEAVRGGVVAYLEKPFDLQTLKQELQRTLGDNAAPPMATYDLTEIARVVNHSRRDLALQAQAGAYTGALRFQRGELLWAEAWGESGRLYGDDAFLMLCAQRNPQVQQIVWTGRLDRNVAQPVARLLFLALLQRDSHEGAGTTNHTPHTPTQGPASQTSLASSSPSSTPLTPGAVHSTASLAGGASQTQPFSAPAHPSAPRGLPPVGAETPSGNLQPPSSLWSGAVGGASGGMPFGQTGPLTPLSPPAAVVSPEQTAAAQRPLRAFADTLPTPCVGALVRGDGALIAQVTRDAVEGPAGAYYHLAQATQAVARSALLASWGAAPDLWIVTTEHALFVRRLAHGERGANATYLCALLPLVANFDALRMAASAHESALLASLTGRP